MNLLFNFLRNVLGGAGRAVDKVIPGDQSFLHKQQQPQQRQPQRQAPQRPAPKPAAKPAPVIRLPKLDIPNIRLKGLEQLGGATGIRPIQPNNPITVGDVASKTPVLGDAIKFANRPVQERTVGNFVKGITGAGIKGAGFVAPPVRVVKLAPGAGLAARGAARFINGMPAGATTSVAGDLVSGKRDLKEIGQNAAISSFLTGSSKVAAPVARAVKKDVQMGAPALRSQTGSIKLPGENNPLNGDTPKTVKVFIKSKFRDGGGYADLPVIRKVENKTLYQGGSADGRQFWTENKKYAEQFGEVTKKKGTFYEVDNGNRMTTVYVDANQAAKGVKLPKKPEVPEQPLPTIPMTAREALPLNVGRTTGTVPTKVNTAKINVDNGTRKFIQDTADSMAPEISKKSGMRLTNQEIKDIADLTPQGLNSETSVETTATLAAQALNARRQVAAMAEKGVATPEFVQALKNLKTFQTNAGRLLQSQGIQADPKAVTPMERLIGEVIKRSDDLDLETVVKAAEGVNFNDPKQAGQFYRQFVKPSAGEWIDLLRYNSMLSSPLTHIVNTGSNLLNTTAVAPAEKLVTGAVDFIRAGVTGTERQALAGEAGAYLKGYWGNVGNAWKGMVDVMKGTGEITNLDMRDIPLAQGGTWGGVYDNLSIPTKLLGGMDVFFRTLGRSGEKAGLKYRQTKGVNIKGDIDTLAEEQAAYRIYQQDTSTGQEGALLRSMDEFTNLIMQARNKEGITGQIAKFTVPFVKTPMNIFKQGIEYSPAGFATIPGAANKQQQLSKAIMGSAVFAGVAGVLASGRLTWAEPTSEKDRNAFREAGMQPYSIKIGDNWVNFSKMPPPIAFPFAMVAAIDDALKSKTIKQGTADAVLEAVSKYGNFLADQSYVKNIGDTLEAVQGDAGDWTKAAANYPQQLIPWKGALGWIARMTDQTERKADKDAGIADRFVQQFMLSIPGLRDNVPARLASDGTPLKMNNPVFNSFSPFRVTTEDPGKKQAYDQLMQDKMDRRNDRAVKEAGGTVAKTDKSPAEKYQSAMESYNKEKGNMTVAEKYKKEKDLNRLKVQKDYSQDVLDLYTLSKTELKTLAEQNPQVNDLLPKVFELDAKMAQLSTAKKTKFGGTVAKLSRASGGKRGRKAKKLKVAKVPAPKISKPKLTKLTNYKVKSSRPKSAKFVIPNGKGGQKKISIKV